MLVLIQDRAAAINAEHLRKIFVEFQGDGYAILAEYSNGAVERLGFRREKDDAVVVYTGLVHALMDGKKVFPMNGEER